jgi:hypothetical protein
MESLTETLESLTVGVDRATNGDYSAAVLVAKSVNGFFYSWPMQIWPREVCPPNGIIVYHYGGLRILTSDYVGMRVQVSFPKAGKGPYQRRRQRRMDHDPRNWVSRSTDEFWLLERENLVICHPDDLRKIQEALEDRGYETEDIPPI